MPFHRRINHRRPGPPAVDARRAPNLHRTEHTAASRATPSRGSPAAFALRRGSCGHPSHHVPIFRGHRPRRVVLDGHDPPHPAPLADDLEVDVAVVGGGIAGLHGLGGGPGRPPVAILEADRIAAGVTGYTTAKLSALHGLLYDRLRATAAPTPPRDYARPSRAPSNMSPRPPELLDIDCELERLPAYTYTERPTGRTRARGGRGRRGGGPAASFVTETGLPFPVAGAVRVEDQAQFHPRNYLLGLAADIRARWHDLRAHPGRRTDEGEPCRLSIESGGGRRPRRGGGHPLPGLRPGAAVHPAPPHRELVVSAPIAADRDPGGMYLTKDGASVRCARAPYGDGQRLLIVTGETFTPGDRGRPRAVRPPDRVDVGALPRHAAGLPLGGAGQRHHRRVPYIGRFHPVPSTPTSPPASAAGA